MSVPDSEEHEAAAIQVFNTAELAEMILLKLPMEDILLHAMRVCKHWKAIIDNSLKLQQALFFKPIPGPPNLSMVMERDDPKRGNLPPPQVPRHTIRINPLANKQRIAWIWDGWRDRSTNMTSSWRRMFFSQPPVYMNGLAGHRNKDGLKLGFVDGPRAGYLCRKCNVEKLLGVPYDILYNLQGPRRV